MFGQCNIVSLQEGQTRIVILKIQGGTHSRRHLIDEAENAVVAAGTVLIHELVLEYDADFLVILFFDFQVPFLAVLFPDREFQIRVVGLEVVIEDVLDRFPRSRGAVHRPVRVPVLRQYCPVLLS